MCTRMSTHMHIQADRERETHTHSHTRTRTHTHLLTLTLTLTLSFIWGWVPECFLSFAFIPFSCECLKLEIIPNRIRSVDLIFQS